MNGSHDKLLRYVLAFDAVTCLLMGSAVLLAGNALGDLLAIPPIVLRAAGAALLVFAAGVGHAARRAQPYGAGVIAVIVLNGLWAVESLLALWAGWLEPNALGTAFVVAQAIAVAVIAELQFIGMRRARAAAAPAAA
ncbi:MAG TPA: hypothetical protein VIN61_00455 [Gammaproteobacteria bacterium]